VDPLGQPDAVLAAVIELVDREGSCCSLATRLAGQVLRLITGFMEAGESPKEGIAREVFEETALTAESCR
jgi:NADH pyrophosphatase NudC (nudix superfamily)